MSEDLTKEAERIRHAGTFGPAAGAYERGRPGYPPEAIDWLLAPFATLESPTVCDLGAGTGKLTRSLVERKLTVVAVEPSEPMLYQLRRAVAAARASLGSAKATGLDDESMDAVLVAQAWHWVGWTNSVGSTPIPPACGGRRSLPENSGSSRGPTDCRESS